MLRLHPLSIDTTGLLRSLANFPEVSSERFPTISGAKGSR